MNDIDSDPKFCSRTSFIQLFYGIWVNLTILATGLAFAFPTIQLPQLNSPASDILVTMEEGSWIASVLILFCPVGCLIGGSMMDRFGRRIPLLSCQIPMFLGWMYTGAAKTARNIIIGRALTGVGCGMAMGVPRLYTSEISLPNMRGVLGALPNIFMPLGFTIQAGMGSYIEWKKLCHICCCFNLALFLSYLLLHESPHYVLLHSSVTDTERSLKHFRSKNYAIDKEVKRLMEFKRDNSIRRLSLLEQFPALFSQSTCKPFGIAMTYIALGCLSGVQIVAIWTIDILMLTNSSFDFYAGNFLIALTRLIFGTTVSFLLFHVGRRPIALVSAIGVGSSNLTLAMFLAHYSEPSIVPQAMFMLYSAFAIMGYQCLPFLLMSEMYPLQIRGTLTGISLTLANIMIFTMTKSFPYIHTAIGIINTLFIFGSASIIASLFLFAFLPETHGLTLQEIEEYFRGIRPTLVSDRSVMEAQLKDSSTLLDKKGSVHMIEKMLSKGTLKMK